MKGTTDPSRNNKDKKSSNLAHYPSRPTTAFCELNSNAKLLRPTTQTNEMRMRPLTIYENCEKFQYHVNI